MGLIKAALGSAGGVLADQWKEYFYCDAMPADVLVMKGQKRTSGRSSNTQGTDNIISSGSVIAVADGQCMLIVEQGKIVDVCAEPGEYTYDAATEPSIFAGELKAAVDACFQNVCKRFTFGGQAPMDQRVYFFNTKELIGNKYGTPAPVPFRVVDERAGIDIDIAIRCFGEYSYKLAAVLHERLRKRKRRLHARGNRQPAEERAAHGSAACICEDLGTGRSLLRDSGPHIGARPSPEGRALRTVG